MRTLRVALAQINPTVGDVDGNVRLIRSGLRRAERAGADLAVFPELAITGYPPEDLVLRPAFIEANVRALDALAGITRETVTVAGYVDRDADGRLFNAAGVLWRGARRGVYRKVCLPNYGVFDEMRYFSPGDRYPLFDIRGVRVGFSVCEDAWIGNGPVRALARMGAEVVCNINASPYHRGKAAERQELFSSRARENKIWFCYLQTVGGQDELVFDGGSLVFDPAGNLVARGPAFEEDLLVVDLSLAGPSPRGGGRAETTRLTPKNAPLRRPRIRRTEPEMPGEAEEVYRALVLGTRDYVLKNGFRSVVLGLSGGIDSSLTAVIAADAIGAQNVHGLAMPSRFSSGHSIEDAKDLAANLGIEFAVVGIEEAHAAFLATLEEQLQRPHAQTAEENLQARIRGTILMALSNACGHLVLATGNKSEMATGYSTLYGDMAGGFAVLKDLPKTLVYAVARWRNERGPAVIPERVFAKPPSAELRPDQRDTDSLPPYEVLDPIIEAYVEQDRSVTEIIRVGFDPETVRRVARMIDLSEYKRRQAPPGIKITHRAFGKDRRLPITNAYREWARREARRP